MGRSKKTWDALVDYDGNYGVHVQDGIFPGSDGTNIKGTKGEKGRNGLPAKKGEPGGQGATGGEGLQGVQGTAGEKGKKGDKFTFAELNLLELEQIKGEKGLKGEEGAVGDTGEKGTASPLLTFRGSFEFNNQFPSTGNNIGDVYYSEENGQYWAWDGAVFQPIGNPVKGEVGNVGEKGKKGDDGLSAYQIAINNGTVLSEDQWVASLKGNDGGPGSEGQKGDKGQRGFGGAGGTKGEEGEKGEKGEIGETLLQDLVLDDYYDKGNISDLIDGHFPPEYAFHYGYSSQLNNVIETGNVSFLNRDRLAPLYDPGPVLIKPGATIVNFGAPPFTATTEMLVINYPYDDPQNSRSQQYQVVQVVYALSTGVNRFESYIRRCQPSTNFFSEWQPHTFNEAYYYTKLEIENLFRQRVQKEYSLESQTNTDAYSADVVLKEHDEYGITLDKDAVTFQGKNGITIYRKDGKILIDGQALSSGLNYVGQIGVGIDPQAVFPAAIDGDFAIYSNTNSEEAWNGERVVPGDWVIFSDAASAVPEWSNLFVGQGAGVTGVDVSGGLLELQGTLTEPVIHLDESHFVLPEDLNQYPTWAVISKIARERQLGSLKDVSVGTDILGYGGFYDKEVLVFGNGIGSYKTNEADQSVLISLNDATNRPMIDFMNGVLIDDTLVRVTSRELDWSLTTKVLDKTFESNGYGLTFADPSIVPLMKSSVSGWNINVLENNEIQPNSCLMWDNYIKKWVAGPQVLDLLFTDQRYLRLDSGGEVFGNIVCNTSIIAREVVGAKTVEVTEAISAASGTLGTIAQPFKGVDNNDIVTVAKLFDELSSYTPGGSVSGDFLPLTGGTLTGMLTMKSDLAFDLADQEPNIRIGNAAALTVSRGPLDIRGNALFTVSAGNINTHGLRISNLGDAIYDGDALSKGAASKFFLNTDGSSEMTGDIVFDNCGFKLSNNKATLTSSGNLTVSTLYSKKSSGWSGQEVVNYSGLVNNFLSKDNPKFTGTITAESDSAQFLSTGGFTFFNDQLRILTLKSTVEFHRNINMGGYKITNLDTPSSDTDVATKKYVDDNGGGGGGGANAHLGTSSNLGRGAIVLSDRDVLSVIL